MYDEYYRQLNLNDLGGQMLYQLGNQIFGGPQSGRPPFGPGFPGSGTFPGGGGGSFPGFPGGGPGSFPGGPGGGSGQFPGGLPPGGVGTFPGGQGSGGTNQPPSGPPPSFTPQQPQAQLFAVDPGAIRGCLYRFTFVWTNSGNFWFYPIFVGRRSVAGYRWSGFRWVYFGIDLDRVQSFQCF